MKRSFTLLIALMGCGQPPTAPTIPYDALSQYGFFKGNMADQAPAGGIVPYDVISVLYADGAGKFRFLVVPQGKQIHFDPLNRWTFPDGTFIIKTFYYELDQRNPGSKRRLLETRLLIDQGGTWDAQTYVWNQAQTEAYRYVAGESIHLDYTDQNGAAGSVDYQVPDSSQCKNCHGQDKLITPLGPRTRQMNRAHDYGNGPENQIAHIASLGLFDADPGDPAKLTALADPRGNAPASDHARAYLDANCAHCHNTHGYASSTNLQLNIETMNAIDLGVCRHPVAAGMASGGFLYDVNPGMPDQSIMVYRMKSNDPQIKMPQLPLTTVDQTGVDLVSQWIAGLSDPPCQ